MPTRLVSLPRLVLAAVTLAAATVSAPVQLSAQRESTCLDAFGGVWRGPGVVLGRPIVMEQRWERALLRSFHELRMLHFRSDTASSPVFEGRGFYRSGGSAATDSVRGVWLDARGLTLTVRGGCEGTRFVSDWSGTTERGRTIYELHEGRLTVVDSVFAAGGSGREFGRSQLIRSTNRP
jgi:hypothetical protein